MAKTLKVLLALVLAATLVFCFAACGKKENGFKRASGTGYEEITDDETESGIVRGYDDYDEDAEEAVEETVEEAVEDYEYSEDEEVVEEYEYADEEEAYYDSSTPDSIVDYIKSNGELEEGVYSIDSFADDGEYISVSYDRNTGDVDVSILAGDDSDAWYHLTIPEGERTYDITYAFTDDNGNEHMINGEFRKGTDLENNYEDIDLSWYAIDETFVEDELDSEQKDAAETLLAMGARFCALYPDVYIFGPEGLSLMEAYDLVA